MRENINEKVVMEFYLELINQDKIKFLQNKPKYKKEIIEYINKLLAADKINSKINIARELWKVLFEASMSFIDSDKQGYDKLFDFFDDFVEFEELIFASDSFYRDHTLHCLWVYFLGEYIYYNPEFNDIIKFDRRENSLLAMKELIDKLGLERSFSGLYVIAEQQERSLLYMDSFRCITSLTHDLGYPIKKITKINKSMKKILPFFSINSYNDFTFEYNNLQQHFITKFIDFISSKFRYSLILGAKLEFLVDEVFEVEDNNVVGLKKDALKAITPERVEQIKEHIKTNFNFTIIPSLVMAFSNDFEGYHHGIMSAFLLSKNLKAFQNDIYVYGKEFENMHSDITLLGIKQGILTSISNHTRETFKIKELDDSSYLTFIDELEEFSRISRASQNREYVEEFCTTQIYVENGWINIDFIFENGSLDNLDPEIAFKGRCKRFLTLFDIPNLSEEVKIKLRCIGKLESNKNIYTLELANKYVDILINEESQNIPKYLKSTQFYTKEEYAKL